MAETISVLPIQEWYREDRRTGDITLYDPFRYGKKLDPNRAPYDVEQAHGRGIEWIYQYGCALTMNLIYGMQDEAADLGASGRLSPYEVFVYGADVYLYAAEGHHIRHDDPVHKNTYAERIREMISRPDAPPSAPIAIDDITTPFERAMYDMGEILSAERDIDRGAIGTLVQGHMQIWTQFARIGEQVPAIVERHPALATKLAVDGLHVCVTAYAPRTDLTRLAEGTGSTVYASLVDTPSLPDLWRDEVPAAILETCVIPGR